MSLSCLSDAKTSTRWKKLIVCWPPAHGPQTCWNQKVGDWDSQNIILLPHHQQIRRMSISWSCTFMSNVTIKNPSLKAIEFGSFEHWPLIFLARPWNKHCTFLHHNPVDWFCRTLGKWIQVGHSIYLYLHPSVSIYINTHSLPLNNMGLNCVDSLNMDSFSLNAYYSTTQSAAGWIWGYRRQTVKLYLNFSLWYWFKLYLNNPACSRLNCISVSHLL